MAGSNPPAATFLLVADLEIALVGFGVVQADEAPISGTVKSVDTGANTITLEVTPRGLS